MSGDDQWRRREREARDPSEEFGGPLFPDQDPARADDTGERRLRFGPNDTGPLPHWTDPPTGEVPRMAPAAASGDDAGEDDDVDVWSSFTTESPIWRDDIDEDPTKDPSGGFRRDPSGSVPRDPSGGFDSDMTGEVRTDALSEPMSRPPTGDIPLVPPRREPGRITIGTDPSGLERRPPAGRTRRGSASQTRSGRPAGPARTSPTPPPPRNLAAAIGAGLVLGALFVIATVWRPLGVVVLITLVLAIAGFEYFGKVTEKGYRPAVAPGLAACLAAPLVAYWVGEAALPLVVAFAFIAGAIGFIGAPGVESGPLPNMAVTTMGVVWIGLLGSYAALIVRWSNVPSANDIGTDTLFLVVLGVVANDIGALALGSSIGKTPLRAWISPGKTLEGLIGGTVLTFLVLFIVGLTGRSDTWTTGDLLVLAAVISVMAPLGDLTESMFKRNLDVKDFGALVRGHGGVLDRFDAFLFVLPVAYYVTLVLEPWN